MEGGSVTYLHTRRSENCATGADVRRPEEKAREFLKGSAQFRLGELPTEARHPRTMNLSYLAENDLGEAVQVLREVDRSALAALLKRIDGVEALTTEMQATLKSGRKIFFCGCGATGRLSLSLETLWCETFPHLATSVCSFMAGGDLALISSIENFEDHPEFGARQLHDLGFQDGDLLVASTEGGETPFVIGAAEEAARVSSRPPYFLYCNPDEILCKVAERSRRVLANPQIVKLNLSVGPMAVSGSTRMQASTVQMLAAGMALFAAVLPHSVSLAQQLQHFMARVDDLDYSLLVDLIRRESQAYQNQEFMLYETDHYGITVLTDTTERAPTFSLLPFENNLDPAAQPALCYLCLPHTDSVQDAWHTLLHRQPRPLPWAEYKDIAGPQRLYGFDFSIRAHSLRRDCLQGRPQHVLAIQRQERKLQFSWDGDVYALPLKDFNLLEEHILLKMLLNSLSTLVMGRMGRYQGNVMTWVRPSNYKLIDRTIRYVQMLLAEAGQVHYDYDAIAHQVFREIERSLPGEPVVMKTVGTLLENTVPRSLP